MSVLSPAQRKLLSDTVSEARDVVEAACAQRVTALGVALDKAPDNLSDDERRLRRALRARARQLGSVEVMVGEAGYEHWHRMLFTRFLADNNLLVDDQTGQPVSMDEVADYAAELGEADVWEVAAKFGAAMLPGIFRQDDPLLQMRLPVETRQRLEELLGALPADIITADDALGWVYQYWQARRKDEVNRSERKIGGADLAPVTQLFTDDYMVRFLLENTLGAWWAARYPKSPLVTEWKYLRFADDGGPAAGSFDMWPKTAAEVTVMDPCCGSGHFLVAAFEMLWRMRAEEEELSPIDAQDAVLKENLFGLELDFRCVEIAMFSIALKAWTAGSGWRALPVPNIACSGMPAKTPVDEWTKLAEGDERLEKSLARLHVLFANADTLGSLIDPPRATSFVRGDQPQRSFDDVEWEHVAPLLEIATRSENLDPATKVLGVDAIGIARAADYLSRTYTLIATNPPFLGRTGQGDVLRDYLVGHYSAGSEDLATAFTLRFLDLAAPQGALCQVIPETALFLGSLNDFRYRILTTTSPRLLALLGPGAFGGISGEVVRVALFITTNQPPSTDSVAWICEASSGGSQNKALELRSGIAMEYVSHSTLLGDRLHRILPGIASSAKRLRLVASSTEGMSTGDGARYQRNFWELDVVDDRWMVFQRAPDKTCAYGGLDTIVLWENGTGALSKDPGARVQGLQVWGHPGILVERMSSLRASVYLGMAFQKSTVVLRANDDALLPAIWCYCESGEHKSAVLAIERRIGIATSAIVDVPFDEEYWRNVALERLPNGLPEPCSNDPTQWLFSGLPEMSTTPLAVAIARLVGYRWPKQFKSDVLEELVDRDGIVCLPAVGGEAPAGDRLLQLLAGAHGDRWNPAVLDDLLQEAGASSGALGLGRWLRNVFFREHCKQFMNRPFIWHIWDGTADGFSALVNYHRLDRRLLERLTYDYLGNWWIGRVRTEVANEVAGAEKRLAAAEQLKKKLELILEGEPPYDVYIRWKTLAEQPLGWDPDLDDGVRLNIRPFVAAGILRSQPKINWNKDRGKNPDGSDRLNDLHYSLAEKRAARGIPR